MPICGTTDTTVLYFVSHLNWSCRDSEIPQMALLNSPERHQATGTFFSNTLFSKLQQKVESEIFNSILEHAIRSANVYIAEWPQCFQLFLF